ncbi:urease accessory protein UreD [Kineococcus sp. SYSU DK003]|uniref:urease accessory protein UreD n=1 Tax=Kineococcus sp. SYSU DK003 TaxID=3383124 RepID=UPI003D7EB87B
MTTRIALHADTSLDLRTDALAPKLLHRGSASARLALVGARALLLAGDHVDLEIEVAAGCALELVEVTGTVAYDGRGGPPSTWTTRVRLHEGAQLTWNAEPFVVADGARVERSLEVDLAPGSTAVLRETFVLGRTGEQGGALRSRTRARLGGAPLLVEDLDLREQTARNSPAVLGTHRCLDTVSLLGARFQHPGALQLDGAATVVRELLGDTTRGALDALWASVREAQPGRPAAVVPDDSPTTVATS